MRLSTAAGLWLSLSDLSRAVYPSSSSSLGAITAKGETVTGVGVHGDKLFGLRHPPITPPEKRMVPSLTKH